MQTTLELEEESSKKIITAESYYNQQDTMWSLDNIIKACDCASNGRSYDVVTAAEWGLMQSALIEALENRRILEDNCDYLLLGTGWENDESHLRHFSVGNFPEGFAGVDDINMTLLNHVESTCSYDFVKSEIAQAAERLIQKYNEQTKDSVKGIKCLQNARFLNFGCDEVMWWKYLAGACTDWDDRFTGKEGKDVMDLVAGDLEKFPHILQGERCNDDGLYCLYISDGHRLILKQITDLFITQPRLVTEGGEEIHWNC